MSSSSSTFGPLEARRALVDLLNAFQSPANRPGLDAARMEASDDMVAHMRIVFPVATAIQVRKEDGNVNKE